MTRLNAYDTPTTVTPVDGEVVLDGPDGVGLSMTPSAADESARRLRRGAAEARRGAGRSKPDAEGKDEAQ